MRPDQMQSSFEEMDEDGGGTIDFEEFQTFYYALTEGDGNDGNAKRMGKEMLANLHANMFNAAIQDAKSKMGAAMLKEQARFQEAVQRMGDEERKKDEAQKKVDQLNLEFQAEKKAREEERLAIFDQAVKAGFSRHVAKEKAFKANVKQARKDLITEMKEAEAEAARRTRNFQEAQEVELERLRKHDDKRKMKKRMKEQQQAEAAHGRVRRLEELEEEEADRLAKVKEQNDRISERNRQKARARATRLEKLKKNTLAETHKAQDAFSLKLQALDNRLQDKEEDRQKSLSARSAAFEEKQQEIKAMEKTAEENRLNLAWTVQTNCLSAETRRLTDLSLKAEESKLWLQTRSKKVERANRRKAMRLAEEKAQILDKHQKLDALGKQQKAFDKKRKMLAQVRTNLPNTFLDAFCSPFFGGTPFISLDCWADCLSFLLTVVLIFGCVCCLQDAYVAKLKLKHEQERQMQMLKQGKKIQVAEDDPAMKMFAKAGHDKEVREHKSCSLLLCIRQLAACSLLLAASVHEPA